MTIRLCLRYMRKGKSRRTGFDRLDAGTLNCNGAWYYQTIASVTDNDGDQMVLLDVLAQQVGVIGIFSDWPGTVSYYASCKNRAVCSVGVIRQTPQRHWGGLSGRKIRPKPSRLIPASARCDKCFAHHHNLPTWS